LTQARSGGPEAAAGPYGAGARYAPTPVSELKPRPVEWLWPKRVPVGAITVIAGEPGLGKSLLTLDLAARLSRGELATEAANSLLLTAEDAREQTLVPRLIAAAADGTRVHVPPKSQDALDLPLRIPNDISRIRDLMRAGEVRLLVVDPFSAHLPGRVNGNSDKSVRGALAPLAALAEEQELAVVLVAHLNKGEGADALRRIGGSIALPAAARSVLLLTRDPDDPEETQGSLRVLAHVKSNLGRLEGSLSYRVDTRKVAGLEDPVAVMRELGASRYTGEQLLALDKQEARSKREEARALLEAELADGVRPATELTAAAKMLGISPTTLDRAKQDLDVKSVKLDLGRWGWKLPEAVDVEGEVAAA
jgi:putative DNA primase/helicase